MRKTILALTLAAIAIPTAPVLADPPPWAPAHGRRAHDVYDSRGRYYTPHVIRRSDYIWRGHDGHYYCRRDNGTTGLVVGAAVGALAGYAIADHSGGDRTVGAIIGAAGGGLLGREIDRGDLQCH